MLLLLQRQALFLLGPAVFELDAVDADPDDFVEPGDRFPFLRNENLFPVRQEGFLPR